MRAVALLLLLALAAPASGQDDRAPPWPDGEWSAVDAALARAAPLPRAALLWTAWDRMAHDKGRVERALRALAEASPLRRLAALPPPWRVTDPAKDPWLREQTAPLLEALAGRGEYARALAAARDQLRWLDDSRLRVAQPALKAATDRPDEAALEALTLACGASPSDPELARILDLALPLPADLAWVAPAALVALGPRATRALWLRMRGPVDALLDAQVAAWWEGTASAAAARDGVAAVASRLAPGGLRRSVEALGEALGEAGRTGWRPPDAAAWAVLGPDERLAQLGRALRLGGGRLPWAGASPPAPSVEGQLELLGWSAVPLLLSLADDEVAGPGAAARRLLDFYGGDLPTAQARRAWWAKAEGAGARAAWEARAPVAWRAPVDGDSVLPDARALIRAVNDLGPDAGRVLATQLCDPRYPARASEQLIRTIEEVAGGLPAPALLDALVPWLEAPRAGVAWSATLALTRRGHPAGVARLPALVERALGARPEPAPVEPLVRAIEGLEALVDQVEGLAPDFADTVTRRLWSAPALLASLEARRARPAARDLLLRVAVAALATGRPDVADRALAALGERAGADGVAGALVAAGVASVDSRAAPLRRLALRLGPDGVAALGRLGVDARASLGRDLLGDAPERALEDLRASQGAAASVRAWLAAALRAEVAALDSGAPLVLSLGEAALAEALPAPLAAQVQGWRALDGRALGALLAAWRGDPRGPAGLELGLARAPRGRLSVRLRPLPAGAPGRFSMEVDGPAATRLEGPATDEVVADALFGAVVDLLLAPDALVDLRLRVWR